MRWSNPAFHPRSDGRGFDLLSGDHNPGTLHVEDRELVTEYAKLFGQSLGMEVRVIDGGAPGGFKTDLEPE